jgi:hypothetical protein
MEHSQVLKDLSDCDLIAEVNRLANSERTAIANLVAGLGEMDARRLYLGQGCSSMFTYCTHVLHFAEHAAFNRIEAARAARRFPIILTLLADGRVHLSALRLLAPHLTAEIVISVVDLSEAEEAPPPACSFCGRAVHDVSTLVRGPAAAICDNCIRSFSTAVRTATELPASASIRDDSEWSCGFCSNQPANTGGVVVRNGAAVCPACLRVCSDILAESANGS